MKSILQYSLFLRSTVKALFWAFLPVCTFAQTGNYFAGTLAGFSNTTGSYNSFVGYQTGFTNLTGKDNSFVGYKAGLSNLMGNYNSFVGSRAGYSNTTGRDNSFVGYRAGYANTEGNANSFVGSYAGAANTKGYQNSFLGYGAGMSNISGANNSYLGYGAGYFNTTGSQNVFVGTQAGVGPLSGSTAANNVLMGYQAGYTIATGGDANVLLGHQAGKANTSGNSNTFVGKDAGLANTTGSGNLFIGSFANANAGTLSNAGAIGYRAQVTTSNSLVLGSIKDVNGATASTNVGIGTTSPDYRLHVNGEAAKPGGGSWKAASDKRLKQDISDFTDGLTVLKKMHPVWFRYNGKAGLSPEQKYVGVIAQEMQQVAPYMIGEFTYQDSTGKREEYLDYDANALTYILVNSVKEQQQQLEEQKQQLQAKDTQLSNQQQQIDALTNRLTQLEALLLKQGTVATSVEETTFLWQNQPNPYSEVTTIRYYVPETATSAQLKIYSSTGQEVHRIDLKQKGAGQVELSSQPFASGVYSYSLFIDQHPVASKKLLLAK